jgi:hypothetical protein
LTGILYELVIDLVGFYKFHSHELWRYIMTAIRDNSTTKQIFIGVIVAVLTAVILGVLGIPKDGGDTVVIESDRYRSDKGQTLRPTPPSRTARVASVCVTPYGSCPLVQSLAPGMSCICYDAYGYPRLAGTAR